METTAGSFALVGSQVRRDSTIVARLRRAGAVILGKANLSEWANFRGIIPPGFPNGWSGRGGFTRNPYVLSWDPCGSSSGSAVAAAANLAALTVGTETDGSIICPAGNNNVVGIKPTLGLVSQQGIIPIGHSQDTAGPMTRTVTDAAILLNTLKSPFGPVKGQQGAPRLPEVPQARGSGGSTDRRRSAQLPGGLLRGPRAEPGDRAGTRRDARRRRDDHRHRPGRMPRPEQLVRAGVHGPAQRVQARRGGVHEAAPPHEDAHPRRPDRVQHRPLRAGDDVLRSGDVRGG